MSSQLTSNFKALLRGLVLVLLLGTGLWLMDRVAQSTLAGRPATSGRRTDAAAQPGAAALPTAPADGAISPRSTPEQGKPPEPSATQAASPASAKQSPEGYPTEPPRGETVAQAPVAPAKETAKEAASTAFVATESRAPREAHDRGSALRIVSRADGRYITTEPILFNSAQAAIRPGSLSTLGKLADLLKAQPEIKLMIIGYTDNLGLEENNSRVSRERASAVRDFLVSRGIEASRMEYKGMGSQNPIASNDTQLGRQANRRIEFLITSPK